MAQKPVKDRLAETLIDLEEIFGNNRSRKILIINQLKICEIFICQKCIVINLSVKKYDSKYDF